MKNDALLRPHPCSGGQKRNAQVKQGSLASDLECCWIERFSNATSLSTVDSGILRLTISSCAMWDSKLIVSDEIVDGGGASATKIPQPARAGGTTNLRIRYSAIR